MTTVGSSCRRPLPGPPGHEEATTILHVDVLLQDRVAVPQAPAVLYFWCEDRPIGEFWLKPGHTIASIAEAFAAAVGRDFVAQAEREWIPPPSSKPTTTLIICTRDRPADLHRCLAAIPGQTLRPDQVLVVDNASVDASVRTIVRDAGYDYIKEERAGLDRARNAGARAASGDLVLYTDDDVELHPRWLERMVAAFDADHIGAVTGLVLPAELQTQAQLHFETFWRLGKGYRGVDFGQEFYASDRTRGCPVWEIGAGASMGFRREVFYSAGFFDDRLDVGAAGCSGDSEFWHRLLRAGWTCRYEPAAVAFHYHRRDFDALLRQIRAYMRGHAAALMVQYERSGNYGNLRRALATMPLYYARRSLRRVSKGRSERDCTLKHEILGFTSGLLFYFRTPRAG